MHEPGPPRATSVGEPVELAPRDPDPAGTYTWRLREAPDASVDDSRPILRGGATSRDDDPVVYLHPDVPGTYVLELDAPDGTHRQRVRAFPDERRRTEIRVSHDELLAAATDEDERCGDIDRVSLMWAHNDNLLARDRAERDGDEWVVDTRVPPGSHGFGFVVDDDPANQHRGVHEVPGPGRPTASLSATVDGDTLVVTADPASPPDAESTSVDRDSDVGVDFLIDDRDAEPGTIDALEARADGNTLSVPIAELPDSVRIHAVPHAARYGVMKTIRIDVVDEGVAAEGVAAEGTRQVTGDDSLPSLTGTDPSVRPAWATAPTIYEVYVRSFAGETLRTTFTEIERRLPYLESLGVDVLWLTPVLASPTEHGYHVTNYFDTADDLGSRESFESLVDRCHAADIRVVFDLVINHTSRDHPAFQLHAAGVDAYRDHYRRAAADVDVSDTDWAALAPVDGRDAAANAAAAPEYYFNWERIPNLNFDSLAVRTWLLDVIDEWAAVVDGFRADVAWGVPHGFWKEVADRVPDGFLLLDETIPHDPFYGEGEFHLHYDSSLYGTLREIGAGREPADAIAGAFERAQWLGFDDPSAQMRYVENHDEERYIAAHGEHAQRAAAAVTFTLPGAPMVYAGQERGAESARGPFSWHDGDNALTDYYRRLSELRDAEPRLRTGEVVFDGPTTDIDVVDGDERAVTAYVRTSDGPVSTASDDGAHDVGTGADGLLVVVNFGDRPATVSVPDVFTHDLFGDDPVERGEVSVDHAAVLEPTEPP
ncbi:hypothetical protein JCM18237_18970 [Halorubrum luteum]